MPSILRVLDGISSQTFSCTHLCEVKYRSASDSLDNARHKTHDDTFRYRYTTFDSKQANLVWLLPRETQVCGTSRRSGTNYTARCLLQSSRVQLFECENARLRGPRITLKKISTRTRPLLETKIGRNSTSGRAPSAHLAVSHSRQGEGQVPVDAARGNSWMGQTWYCLSDWP